VEQAALYFEFFIEKTCDKNIALLIPLFDDYSQEIITRYEDSMIIQTMGLKLMNTFRNQRGLLSDAEKNYTFNILNVFNKKGTAKQVGFNFQYQSSRLY